MGPTVPFFSSAVVHRQVWAMYGVHFRIGLFLVGEFLGGWVLPPLACLALG